MRQPEIRFDGLLEVSVYPKCKSKKEVITEPKLTNPPPLPPWE